MILTKVYEDLFKLEDKSYTIDLMRLSKTDERVILTPSGQTVSLDSIKKVMEIVEKHKVNLYFTEYGKFEIKKRRKNIE
jgi:hypothetical protein